MCRQDVSGWATESERSVGYFQHHIMITVFSYYVISPQCYISNCLISDLTIIHVICFSISLQSNPHQNQRDAGWHLEDPSKRPASKARQWPRLKKEVGPCGPQITQVVWLWVAMDCHRSWCFWNSGTGTFMFGPSQFKHNLFEYVWLCYLILSCMCSFMFICGLYILAIEFHAKVSPNG